MVVQKRDLIQEIAEEHDRRARKDATLNMRVNSDFLADIKTAAKKQGFEKYQAWLTIIIQDAINEANGIEVKKF